MTRFLKTTALLTALALSPLVAQAGAVTLHAPLHGATVQEAGVSISVYYTALPDGALRVVATHGAQGADSQRLDIALRDGDATRRALPGQPHPVYALFQRDGAVVTVSTTPAGAQLAASR